MKHIRIIISWIHVFYKSNAGKFPKSSPFIQKVLFSAPHFLSVLCEKMIFFSLPESSICPCLQKIPTKFQKPLAFSKKVCYNINDNFV